mmetsp:Transcript_2137/g.5655  ORF Transcript_2137/g.5655 Transcript_2137/m.5655 type:complete len:454 (+) Transcript_2137:123-1484(+)
MEGRNGYYGVPLISLLMLSPLLLMQAATGWSQSPLPSLAHRPKKITTGGSSFVAPSRMPFATTAKSVQLPATRLYGVLSRSVILKHSSGSNKKNKNQKGGAKSGRSTPYRGTNPTYREEQSLTKTFLLDALEEASHRQTIALGCLETEHKKLIDKVRVVDSKTPQLERKSISENSSTDDAPEVDDTPIGNNVDGAVEHSRNDDASTKNERDPITALHRVNTRKLEINEKLRLLEEIRSDLKMSGSRDNSDNKRADIDHCNDEPSLTITEAEFRFRTIIGSVGKTCPILDRPRCTWKIESKSSESEFGRPRGFAGLVFYSPLGVPILVGKQRAESDGVLRRAAQGSDLWFQVEDYEGSRVLLRSSLIRGTKNSKKCVQMAADLAARYSMWGNASSAVGSHRHRHNLNKVAVMYTDSKHVAKRGTKVGRMRKRKSLGRVMGRPSSVEAITRGLEP